MTIPEGGKRCRICEKVKPLSAYYMRRDRRRTKAYPASYCKICANRINNERRKRARRQPGYVPPKRKPRKKPQAWTPTRAIRHRIAALTRRRKKIDGNLDMLRAELRRLTSR